MREYKSETAQALDSLAKQVANLGFARYTNPCDGPGAIEGLTMHLDESAADLIRALDRHTEATEKVADSLQECARGLYAIGQAIHNVTQKL